MKAWQLFSTRNPLWSVGGGALLLGIAGLTGYYMTLGPRPLQPVADSPLPGQGTQGRYGTFIEQLGEGKFALSYETIQGTQTEIQLQKVTGRLEEPLTIWDMVSPAAHREKGIWVLQGPMDVSAQEAGQDHVLEGKGFMKEAAPALRWDHGVWTGLSTLVWDDLQGAGRGRWILPPGWHRGLDGVFRVDQGPVHWTAAEPGTLKTLTAERMEAALGFREGRMEEATAAMTGGTIQAHVVAIQTLMVVFEEPIRFQREDGWTGSASHGQAPRPPEGKPFEQIELKDFQATRPIEGGTESIQSLGARWTTAGLRLEGDVRLEQPLDGQKALLRAPRVLQRTGPGPDLPAALTVGETWAEPQAVLTWGEQRTLSSPRIEGRHKQRTWLIRAPALGRGEQGTFSAGEGSGTPLKWDFKGPIQAQFFDGGNMRSDHLTWEGPVMTLTGRPATWTRLRQRLAGLKVIRTKELVQFPLGISGALAATEGDINLRADRGQAKGLLLDLDGRVECQGQAWRLQANHISVTLGPGNVVKQITANGSVVLKGRMGEGVGETLDLDPQKQTANWHGDVKALTEVLP